MEQNCSLGYRLLGKVLRIRTFFAKIFSKFKFYTSLPLFWCKRKRNKDVLTFKFWKNIYLRFDDRQTCWTWWTHAGGMYLITNATYVFSVGNCPKKYEWKRQVIIAIYRSPVSDRTLFLSKLSTLFRKINREIKNKII